MFPGHSFNLYRAGSEGSGWPGVLWMHSTCAGLGPPPGLRFQGLVHPVLSQVVALEVKKGSPWMGEGPLYSDFQCPTPNC